MLASAQDTPYAAELPVAPIFYHALCIILWTLGIRQALNLLESIWNRRKRHLGRVETGKTVGRKLS